MKLTPMRTLVLLVLGGSIWYFRAEISAAVTDVEGAGTRFATWMEMNELAEGMRAHLRTDPAPASFPAWIDERFPDKVKKGVERKPSMDRYGKPYVLEFDRQGGALIRSCGPDQQCRNEDDIEVEVKVEG